MPATIEFSPTPDHPWYPVVSRVVGESLGCPAHELSDPVIMDRHLKPNLYAYHGIAEGERLDVFGALQVIRPKSETAGGLHMKIVYLATAPDSPRLGARSEMLRRLEGASTYAGAVLVGTFPRTNNEAEFYRVHGYTKRPEISVGGWFKSLALKTYWTG